jgi:hypothetical protein
MEDRKEALLGDISALSRLTELPRRVACWPSTTSVANATCRVLWLNLRRLLGDSIDLFGDCAASPSSPSTTDFADLSELLRLFRCASCAYRSAASLNIRCCNVSSEVSTTSSRGAILKIILWGLGGA